jgi:hypothetical protein
MDQHSFRGVLRARDTRIPAQVLYFAVDFGIVQSTRRLRRTRLPG